MAKAILIQTKNCNIATIFQLILSLIVPFKNICINVYMLKNVFSSPYYCSVEKNILGQLHLQVPSTYMRTTFGTVCVPHNSRKQ